MSRRKQPTETIQSTVEDAISDGMSGVEEIRDELQEWKDNLENNNMSQVPKFAELEEAVEPLDEICDDVPDTDCLSEIELPALTIMLMKGSRTRGLSRAKRLSNAVSYLSAAQNALSEWLNDESNSEHEKRDEVETLRDDLESKEGLADGVSVPGMY